MCERLGCEKPAVLMLCDSPAGSEGVSGHMVAYCVVHAGETGYAAMLNASTAAQRQGPGRQGPKGKLAAAAS
jgi:hypothetical protein